jgi:rhodanese-related sulfurtransferase
MPKGSLQTRLNELPSDRLLVSYCACPAEHLSLDASLVMRRGGRRNVAILVGGLRAWIKDGLPTESGTTK